MLSVFLSHSSADKPFVRELADFLEAGGEIRVWLDEREIQAGENIVLKIGEGLDADAVLLILSPDSVGSRWVKEEWTDAFWEQTNSGARKLAGVLHRDCEIPRLLRNKKYFDLRRNQPEGMREIHTWLLGQRYRPAGHFYAPSRPPIFVGREDELARLRRELAEPGSVAIVAGMAGIGKSTVALEFVHRYQEDFEAVYWLACVGRDLTAIAGELSVQLGVKIEGDIETVLRELNALCSQKRYLLALDNVDNEDVGRLLPSGRASVLVTSRQDHWDFAPYREPVRPEIFNEQECLDLFSKVLGEAEVAKAGNAATQLFKRVGYLPIAVAVVAGLVKHDVRFTIESLVENLELSRLRFAKDNVGVLLREAIGAASENARKLLAAMAACAPDGFRLKLAAEVAGLQDEAAGDALQELHERALVEEADRRAGRYRLHSLVREAAGATDEMRLRHAEVVDGWFAEWEGNWRERQEDFGDLRVALDWALGQDGEPAWDLARRIGYSGLRLGQRIGRLLEALEICDKLISPSSARGDRYALQALYGNKALILKRWGRLEEALELHERGEAMCEELGDRDGLQRSYGNRALILRAWGRLEEALELHKKKEAICEELGNRNSLQISYGNQAVILQVWGRLEEALALHKKEEAMCEELGNRGGLQASYGNQALILQNWGRLEEALALHKKQEAICEELGDRDSLQKSYCNQALILQDWGRLEEALALHKKQEEICEELGNRDGLQRSYGNQALILRAWGRLEEALALLELKEKLAVELGRRDGLAYCYWAMASVRLQGGELRQARRRAGESLRIYSELKMPREMQAARALLDEIEGKIGSGGGDV
jgi:tetratricopeptide (TPR) repeat protein